MGKTTDKFEISTATKVSKTYAADRARNVELLMLVLEFKVEYRLKNIQRCFVWNAWNVLMKEKGHFLYVGGRAILIAKLPYTMMI